MGILEKPVKGFNYLSGKDLKAGVYLKLKSAKTIQYEGDAKYAPKPESKLVETGVLKLGETMQYTFDKYDKVNNGWEEVVLENSSTGFYMSLSNIDPDADTIFHARRVGDNTATKYPMKVVTLEEFTAEANKPF